MTEREAQKPGLGEKIELIGREAQLEDLENLLQKRSENYLVYYIGEGGTGKTRLLEELVRRVEQAGPGFLTTGIIDLYHTDNHTTSEVERILVEKFDPEKIFFPKYRALRALYLDMRERGSGTERLEQMREQLSETLITEWKDLALQSKRLVLIFDTVEQIQYESSVVESTAGLDTVDTLVKTWLLTILPRLTNVLVVFAGRPKESGSKTKPEKLNNHQARLEQQMREAFKEGKFDVTRCPQVLKGLTLDQTREFLRRLCGPDEVIPEDILPLVHHLTAGGPIFLHLIVDLMGCMTSEYKELLTWFRDHVDLVGLKENDPRLEEARQEVKVRIVRSIFNDASELGLYLGWIAMMPKGIDPEVLRASPGMPEDEALSFIQRIENLSFVKRFVPQNTDSAPFQNRLFLHDEMYHLFRQVEHRPKRIANERHVANSLVLNYYTPKIKEAEAELETLPPEARGAKRRRLQRLHIERLYYMLVQNTREAFDEYKRLSDEANRRKFVGFNMGLHDEFLRFYNNDERRAQFKQNHILEDQVVRESTEMWIERFHWWGQYNHVVAFAEKILDDSGKLDIDPEKHVEILGNIVALYGRARVILHGFEPETARLLESWYSRQPKQSKTQKQSLTRGRLAVSLGFLYRSGGRLGDATHYYQEAQGDLSALSRYYDEMAMLLNNLAYVYACQGRFELADPIIGRALQLTENQPAIRGSAGLAVSTRAAIDIIKGNYTDAVHHAEEAKYQFNQIHDPWGEILAMTNIANAKRKQAKRAINQGLNLDDAWRQLEEARLALEEALSQAQSNQFENQLEQLYADLGKVYREMARLARITRDKGNPEELFQHSADDFEKALERMRRKLEAQNGSDAAAGLAETEVDLAEMLFLRGAMENAKEMLTKALADFGSDYQLAPGGNVDTGSWVSANLLPLGKVERLYGDMALERKDYGDGLLRMFRAYVYFDLFSKSAPEKGPVISTIYRALWDLPVDHRRALIADMQSVIEKDYNPFREIGFIETLRVLLG